MPVAEWVCMASGGKQGAKVGAFGMLALVAALVGPGVATVSAQPAAVQPAMVAPVVESAAALPVEAVKVEETEVVVPEAVSAPVVAKRHLRRLKQCDLNNDLIVASADLIKKHHSKRFGSEVEVEIAGKPYVARIERHFHPEGGPIKPWGFHPGVSLFAVE
jgi:hypothetical protein